MPVVGKVIGSMDWACTSTQISPTSSDITTMIGKMGLEYMSGQMGPFIRASGRTGYGRVRGGVFLENLICMRDNSSSIRCMGKEPSSILMALFTKESFITVNGKDSDAVYGLTAASIWGTGGAGRKRGAG